MADTTPETPAPETQTAKLPRQFRVRGQKVADPDRKLTPEQVKEKLGEQYPDLSNATMTGPVVENGFDVYEIKPQPGSKG